MPDFVGMLEKAEEEISELEDKIKLLEEKNSNLMSALKTSNTFSGSLITEIDKLKKFLDKLSDENYLPTGWKWLMETIMDG